MPHVVSSVRLTALCFAVSQFGSCLNHISYICIYIAANWWQLCRQLSMSVCRIMFTQIPREYSEVYLLAIFKLSKWKGEIFLSILCIKKLTKFYKSNFQKYNYSKMKFKAILLSSVAGKSSWDAKWPSKWLWESSGTFCLWWIAQFKL